MTAFATPLSSGWDPSELVLPVTAFATELSLGCDGPATMPTDESAAAESLDSLPLVVRAIAPAATAAVAAIAARTAFRCRPRWRLRC